LNLEKKPKQEKPQASPDMREINDCDSAF